MTFSATKNEMQKEVSENVFTRVDRRFNLKTLTVIAHETAYHLVLTFHRSNVSVFSFCNLSRVWGSNHIIGEDLSPGRDCLL